MQLRNRNIQSSPNGSVLIEDNDGDVTDTTADFSDNSEDFSQVRPRKTSVFKHVLTRKIFVGEYKERRFVEDLKCYRDIVNVEDEEEFIKGLKNMQKISNIHYQKKWLGITTEETNKTKPKYTLWVELEGIPLGKYWFKIHSVIIRDREIILQLKKLMVYETTAKSQNCDLSTFEFHEVFNLTTAWEVMKFSVVLIATIITCAVNALPYLADYTLKFMRELNNTLRVLTPIFLACIDMVTKCIGGLYWMLIMVFKNPPVQRSNNYYPLPIRGRKSFF